MSENQKKVEMHGCIVCAKIYNVLAVYSLDGGLVSCTVTSPGGHILPNRHRPLVACDIHTAEQVKSAYKRWQSTNAKESNHEKEEE
jgi:hypothetical protein